MRAMSLGAAALTAATLLAAAAEPAGAQAPPGTDVYLAPLSVRDGRPVVGSPVNVTARAGYDNQPAFTPDSRAIWYTSIRDDGQSDIYRYDIAAKTTSRVTSTPESEYSATPMPGGRRISVIRVERDSAQRLWSFALDGSDPRLVIQNLAPVGYHAWLDATHVVSFVLGRPNALVYTDLQSMRSDTLARDIGRSLLRWNDGFSFVQHSSNGATLEGMHWPSRRIDSLVALPRGTEDIAWANGNGTLALAGRGTTLVCWRPGDADWRPVADLAAAGLTNITRLAVSANGRWIAIVAVPKG